MARNRRYFTDEFKREAVRLVEQHDGSVSQAARDLGRDASVLRRWVAQMRGGTWESTPGKPLKSAQQLVTDALMMALHRRGRPREVLHHSDQGSQYTSEQFQMLLMEAGIVCSMSKRGDCWDNAAMESFFSTLKTERLNRHVYRTRDECRADVFDYIERFFCFTMTPAR